MAQYNYNDNNIDFVIESNDVIQIPKISNMDGSIKRGYIVPLINAIEIDWNKASLNLPTSLNCPTQINKTSELLSIIKNLGTEIVNLKSAINTLQEGKKDLTISNISYGINENQSDTLNIGYHDYIILSFNTNANATCVITSAQSEFYDTSVYTNSTPHFGYGWKVKVISNTGKIHKIKIYNTLSINDYTSNESSNTKSYYIKTNDIKIILLSDDNEYKSLVNNQNILNLENPDNENIKINLYSSYGYFYGNEYQFNQIINGTNSLNTRYTANEIINSLNDNNNGYWIYIKSISKNNYIMYPTKISNLGLYQKMYYSGNYYQSLVLNQDYEEIGIYSINGITYRACKFLNSISGGIYIK